MFYNFINITLEFLFQFFIFFFISLIILVFMLFLHKRSKRIYIKKCLLKFNLLEKEILKTILKYKDKKFPLTSNSPITKKFLELNILFKSDEISDNPLHYVYYLNLEVFNLIRKDSELVKIYF
ncbi:super-infection exclusion protein B [Candidatus Phytoplasma oryzae]|nr:hypothetical protein PIE28_00050 [Candidatus Phytoplasma oryzae]